MSPEPACCKSFDNVILTCLIFHPSTHNKVDMKLYSFRNANSFYHCTARFSRLCEKRISFRQGKESSSLTYTIHICMIVHHNCCTLHRPSLASVGKTLSSINFDLSAVETPHNCRAQKKDGKTAQIYLIEEFLSVGNKTIRHGDLVGRRMGTYLYKRNESLRMLLL